MKRKTLLIPALFATGLCLGMATSSPAQTPPPRPNYRPQVHIDLYTPLGQPVTQRQDQYQYVVPPASRFGAFYTYENDYYYTPAAVRVPGRRPIAPRPVKLVFGANRYIDELAERIESLANELCLDLHHNYRHNPRYKEIYGEAYQLLQTAKFVHAKEHWGDREGLRRSVTRLDELFHHVQQDVVALERREARRIGVHGLEGKTEEMEALIHHMMYDQGIKPRHDRDNHDRPGPGRGPGGRVEAPPPRP
jgi:hypothetical protein